MYFLCVVCVSHGCTLNPVSIFFFFQAEDGIRDHAQSRGLGDVYKRQPVNPLLEIHGLEVAYGPSQVLFGLDLRMNEGEATTLLGRNGMGKTTTLRAICGLQAVKGGSIRKRSCLLYTSDAADDMQCVDLGGRRIIQKKKSEQQP
eukprot:TRINITY_DN4867_c0_g2_i1.p1 TRINITY_DN4867_c0_g2~~TRINITY_DN4867_c0_g2_i1.p1  ORF type:complete len:145 (-),score=31.52 TRINITY_DN4867_c0_g2_i1:99-533(-)